RPSKNPLCVLLQWCGTARQFNTVVVQAPQQRSKSHVKHGKLFAQHELVLQEHRSDLRQTITDVLACMLECLFVALCRARFKRADVHEKLFLEVVEEQAGATTHDGISRHELRMGKTLVDILVDDV